MQKIIISKEASNRKGNLRMSENMGFLAPKRNSSSDSFTYLDWTDGYFMGSEKSSHSTK